MRRWLVFALALGLGVGVALATFWTLNGGGVPVSKHENSVAASAHLDLPRENIPIVPASAAPVAASSAASASSPAAVTVSSVWGTPQGLGSLVDEALRGSPNVPILQIVDALRTCEFAAGHLVAAERAMSTTADLQLKKVHFEKYQQLQRKVSDCQTVAGDLAAVQLRLLHAAVERGEIGAAALLLTVEPQDGTQLMKSIVRDASAGDMVSIAQVISRAPDDVGITAEAHQVLAVALYRARHVAAVEVEAKEYLNMAASWSNARVAAEGRQSSPLVISMTKPVTAETEKRVGVVLSAIIQRNGGRV